MAVKTERQEEEQKKKEIDEKNTGFLRRLAENESGRTRRVWAHPKRRQKVQVSRPLPFTRGRLISVR